MMKRILSATAIFFALTVQALCAGTISLSLSQQFDSLGNPLNGGKLYLFQAGTTTPQNAYSDSALTLPLPNPITLDSAGRIVQFFLADGTIKIRLTNSAGVTQVSADGIMVIGASSGSGTGSVVDATTVLATGDVKTRYGTGSLTGFVRLNGRTIGSATSGATERANADCQELFEYLWGEDANLSVSTGRGASAAADWAANKTIALPDGRGRILAGLDDMGNSAAGRLTSTYFGTATTALGAVSSFGDNRQLLATHLPPHTHSGTTGDDTPDHTHGGLLTNNNITSGSYTTSSVNSYWSGTSGSTSGASARHHHPFTTDNGTGSSTPLSIIPPTLLATIYMKL